MNVQQIPSANGAHSFIQQTFIIEPIIHWAPGSVSRAATFRLTVAKFSEDWMAFTSFLLPTLSLTQAHLVLRAPVPSLAPRDQSAGSTMDFDCSRCLSAESLTLGLSPGAITHAAPLGKLFNFSEPQFPHLANRHK